MDNIRKFRALKGLTQAQFAKMVGVNRVTVIAWESPETVWLPEATAKRIADFFKVSVDELYGKDACSRYLKFELKNHAECEAAIKAIKGSKAWVS